MNNQSKLTFTDISSESKRTYVFPEGSVTIDQPTHLNVSANGHRLLSKDKISHYVPKGWIHLFWEVEEGSPNFVT